MHERRGFPTNGQLVVCMTASPEAQGYAHRLLDEGFGRLVAVAFVLLGVIFGLMQPLGSAQLGRPGAVVFWLLHGLAAIPCAVGATLLLSRLGLGRRLSPMGFVIVSGLVAAVGLSLFALGIERAFGVGDAAPEDLGVLAGMGWLGAWLDELAGLTPPFLLAWVLVNLPRLMRLGSSTGPAMPEAPTPSPVDRAAAGAGKPAEGLLSRLPEALGSDIVLLSSDLHYLHVYTTRGRTMVLYNLADAEAELGSRGIRVHRSHWVADRHVLGVRPKAGGLVCRLAGGLEAPVSRRRQKEIVARFGRDASYYAGDRGGAV